MSVCVTVLRSTDTPVVHGDNAAGAPAHVDSP
jgi:hypothetical protein